MLRIVTIHPVKEIHRYGFESTQVYRARIARHLGLEYVHLVSSPQLRPDWKKDLIKLGFLEKELICVPHSFSDIGHADLSVRPESLTLADGDQVELNEDGFVAAVTLGDGSGRYYYTKGPFLFEDFKERNFVGIMKMENWLWKDALSIPSKNPLLSLSFIQNTSTA